MRGGVTAREGHELLEVEGADAGDEYTSRRPRPLPELGEPDERFHRGGPKVLSLVEANDRFEPFEQLEVAEPFVLPASGRFSLHRRHITE